MVIIGGFLLWGTKKGLILEISEIVGLIAAFLLAMFLPFNLQIGGWKYVVSFLIYFLTISIGFSILSKIINKTPLALIDKILGSVIGTLKGIIVVIILFLIISVVPSSSGYRVIRESYFYNAALHVKPILKDFLERKMRKIEPPDKILPPDRKTLT